MISGNLLRIVLTGGPCAGKSSALSRLIEWLDGLGYRTAIVPEAATELITNGIRPEKFSDPIVFQRTLLRNILCKEELFSQAVLEMREFETGRPAVLLCDRGCKDGEGYVGREDYAKILADENLDQVSACDKRYAAVIHLRTAADGKEEFYTLANNTARRESPAEARILDRLTEAAWHGHPRLIIIDNASPDFEGKILKVRQAVSSILGIPSPVEHERKFLLQTHALRIDIPIPSVTVEIEQHYLDKEGERIRKRSRDGAFMYFHTWKENCPQASRMRVDKIIGEQEYLRLLERKRTDTGTIRKSRTYFVWNNQYFELDHFYHNGMWLLEVRPTAEQREIIIPPFLPETIEVTDNYNYYNFNIALILKDSF